MQRTFLLSALLCSLVYSIPHASAMNIEFAPALLAGTDITSKLPQWLQNIVRSGTELNDSLKTWAPSRQSFEGAGERFRETLRTAFRAIAGLLLALFAWIVELASNLVFWVAGMAVILINWLLVTARVIP